MPDHQSSKADLFEAERDRLFGLAYRMLGSVADADDIVQEAWLRFEPSTGIENPGGFLTTVATRLCVDRLRSAQQRRETYVGPWLAEPLLTDLDPAHLVVLDESVRLGFLHVLDELSAVERAVFLLHDVFDVSYADVAAMVDRTEANCRQIARRARDRLRAERTWSDPAHVIDAQANEQLLAAFLGALASGDPQQLGDMLADDVVLVSDGGAHRRAARHPILGRDRVARFVTTLANRMSSGATLELAEVNGLPGLMMVVDGAPVMVVEVEFVGGRVVRVHAMLNPDKLELSRQTWRDRTSTPD